MRTTNKSIRQQVSHEYQFNNDKSRKSVAFGRRVLGLLIVLASMALGMLCTSFGDELSDGTMAMPLLVVGAYLMFSKADNSKEVM